jgi:outer membrane beta-barrel protein
MKQRCLWLAAILAIVAAAPVPAAAQGATGIPVLDELGDREIGELEIIQNRKYDLLNEISLLGGGLPGDPYYKGITATLGYAIHFSDFAAWEIAQFTYSYNIKSKLGEEVERIARANVLNPPNFPELNWFVASHLVLKPIYGKQALFNTEVVHIEAFIQAGPAIVNRSIPETTFNVGADFGAGLRLWLTEVISVRIDLSELLFLTTEGLGQAMHLHAGFAFNLRGEE